jgi:hypothetical protein
MPARLIAKILLILLTITLPTGTAGKRLEPLLKRFQLVTYGQASASERFAEQELPCVPILISFDKFLDD